MITDEMVRDARKRVALDAPGLLLSVEASTALITAAYPLIRARVLGEAAAVARQIAEGATTDDYRSAAAFDVEDAILALAHQEQETDR